MYGQQQIGCCWIGHDGVVQISPVIACGKFISQRTPVLVQGVIIQLEPSFLANQNGVFDDELRVRIDARCADAAGSLNLAGIGGSDIHIGRCIADTVYPATTLKNNGISLRIPGKIPDYGILPDPIAYGGGVNDAGTWRTQGDQFTPGKAGGYGSKSRRIIGVFKNAEGNFSFELALGGLAADK